jgi:hypothetical protein
MNNFFFKITFFFIIIQNIFYSSDEKNNNLISSSDKLNNNQLNSDKLKKKKNSLAFIPNSIKKQIEEQASVEKAKMEIIQKGHRSSLKIIEEQEQKTKKENNIFISLFSNNNNANNNNNDNQKTKSQDLKKKSILINQKKLAEEDNQKKQVSLDLTIKKKEFQWIGPDDAPRYNNPSYWEDLKQKAEDRSKNFDVAIPEITDKKYLEEWDKYINNVRKSIKDIKTTPFSYHVDQSIVPEKRVLQKRGINSNQDLKKLPAYQRNLINLEIQIEKMNQNYNSENNEKKLFNNKAKKLYAKEQITFIENTLNEKKFNSLNKNYYLNNNDIIALQKKIKMLNTKINQINNENSQIDHISIPIKQKNEKIIQKPECGIGKCKNYIFDFGKIAIKGLFYIGPYAISVVSLYNGYKN